MNKWMDGWLAGKRRIKMKKGEKAKRIENGSMNVQKNKTKVKEEKRNEETAINAIYAS